MTKIKLYEEAIQNYLDKLKDEISSFPKYIVKTTKLPRKLKKAHRKKGIIDITIVEVVETISLDIELEKVVKDE